MATKPEQDTWDFLGSVNVLDGFGGPRAQEGKSLGHEAWGVACSLSQPAPSWVSASVISGCSPPPTQNAAGSPVGATSRFGESILSALKGFPGSPDGEGLSATPPHGSGGQEVCTDAWQAGVASRVLGLP